MKIDWKTILHLAVPLVCAVVPGAAPLTPLILAGISEAESLSGASGAEKKAHALNLVATGIAATNAAAGKEILEPIATSATASAVIDSVVGVTNLVHAAHAGV